MKTRNGKDSTKKDKESSEQELSEYEKLVNVCRVVCELYHQQNPNYNFTISDILSPDKSFRKMPVVRSAHDQQINKTVLFSSTTCRISEEELFKGGCKKSKGETSSSSGYYKYANVSTSSGDRDDQVVVTDKVVGKKRKCYDWEDENFVYPDELVNEKVPGKCYDPIDEDSEYSENKEKKPRRNNKGRNKVVETAPLPVEFADKIQELGGNDVRLLIQKKLTKTDLNPKENRLNISINQLREEANDFLTEDEKIDLDKRNAQGKIVSMQVPLLEPNLDRSYTDFRKWKASTSFWYVLCGSWTLLHTRNHLEAHTYLQVWSFRVNGKLNLALVKVPLPVPGMEQQ